MEKNQSDSEPKKGGTLPQIAIYQKIASREEEIIEKLFEILKSRNENVALGAAKTLINKIIPDRKAVEVTGQNGEPIKFNIVLGNGYIPPNIQSNATPEGNPVSGQPQVQDNSLAQAGKKDDNSNNGTGQTSSG